MDTSCSVLGGRVRSLSDSPAVNPPSQLGDVKRSRGDAQVATLVIDLAAVKEHAQWWSSDLKPQLGALNNQMAPGSDVAASAWIADACERILGHELTAEEELACRKLVQEGKVRELEASKKFKVFSSAGD